MIMNAIKLSCILFFYFLADSTGQDQKLFFLNLEKAYEKQELITSKDFVQYFKYVKLETAPECHVGANPRIDLTDDEIIITDRDRCLVFDKRSGSFIRQIGHIGRDPEGYRHTTQGFLNKNTKMFYFLGWNNNFNKYSIDGKFIGSIPIPNYDNFDPAFAPEKFTFLGDKLIVCNLFNSNGIQSRLLMIFDELGNEVKSIPNRNITKEHNISLTTKEVEFCAQDNKLLYYEIYNDTVFHINLDKTTPYIIWDRGKYRTTRIKRSLEQITPRYILESQKFITFSFIMPQNRRYFALFDKSYSNLRICEIKGGVYNDVNGFMPFFPILIHKEEMVGLLQPTEILNWIAQNSKSKIEISSDLKKFLSVDPTDNPIVVFATLCK